MLPCRVIVLGNGCAFEQSEQSRSATRFVAVKIAYEYAREDLQISDHFLVFIS